MQGERQNNKSYNGILTYFPFVFFLLVFNTGRMIKTNIKQILLFLVLLLKYKFYK